MTLSYEEKGTLLISLASYRARRADDLSEQEDEELIALMRKINNAEVEN